MNQNLVIYGIGRYAEYVAYAFQEDSQFNVSAFCIEDKLHTSDKINDKPLIKFSELTRTYNPKEYSIFIAVGNNYIRHRIYQQAQKYGYEFPNYISSQCRKWNNLKVGSNSFIDEGCVLQPFVEVGNNCILFTTDIGHHSKIENHSLMSGAKTGGNVVIGKFSYIGLNASIKQNIRIGENSMIGMNCNIEKDTEMNSVYTHKGTIKRDIDASVLGNRFLK